VGQLKKFIAGVGALIFLSCAACTDGQMLLLTSIPMDGDTDPETEPVVDGTDTTVDLCTDNDSDADGLCDDVDPCPEVSDAAQAPYEGVTHEIPGVIELEFYDEGGPCVAYMDQDSENRGDTDPFRVEEGVDAHGQQVETPGDYVVGFTYAGEWVEYTVNTQAGVYDIELRYSSEMAGVAEGSVELRLDEQVLGTFTFPDTGAFSAFGSAMLTEVPGPALSSGVLRLIFEERYINYSWISFTVAP